MVSVAISVMEDGGKSRQLKTTLAPMLEDTCTDDELLSTYPLLVRAQQARGTSTTAPRAVFILSPSKGGLHSFTFKLSTFHTTFAIPFTKHS